MSPPGFSATMDPMMHEMPKPLRLLVADDNAATRTATIALLEAGPVQVTVFQAADGQEALRLAASVRPNVVLMDVQMPRLDGITAARRIKQQWPGIRIVVLTMHPGHRADALAAGADAFLLKGGPTDELFNAIFLSQGDVPCNRKGTST
jgi:two-component system response regulator DesR